MEEKQEQELKAGRINADILTLIELVKKIGWKEIRNLSIHRILYLSSVIYSFKYPEQENPFQRDYNFNVDLRGPYSDDVRQSIESLLVKDYLEGKQTTNLTLGKEYPVDFASISDYPLKKDWLDIIVHLVGKYSEDKIYDFIFMDPEYRHNIEINSVKPLSLDIHNETVKALNNFKEAFEKTLGEDAKIIDAKGYLDLYFDFIFSQIIKGVN
jgi:hypothetical protein